MKDGPDSFPRPRNPYGVVLTLLALLAMGGAIAIWISGMGTSPAPNLGLFIPGLMVLTLALIIGIGVFYSWRGFEQRFGPGSLLGYWEVPKVDWVDHLEREKRRLRKRGVIAGIGLPAVVLLVFLFLASSEGDLEKALPVALMVSGLMAVLLFGIVTLQWFSLKGNQGCVWLSERGVMVNRVVFFIDGFGMRTLSREVREEDGKLVLSIRYQVRSRHTVVDKELLVPVPVEQVDLVTRAVERWNAAG